MCLCTRYCICNNRITTYYMFIYIIQQYFSLRVYRCMRRFGRGLRNFRRVTRKYLTVQSLTHIKNHAQWVCCYHWSHQCPDLYGRQLWTGNYRRNAYAIDICYRPTEKLSIQQYDDIIVSRLIFNIPSVVSYKWS